MSNEIIKMAQDLAEDEKIQESEKADVFANTTKAIMHKWGQCKSCSNLINGIYSQFLVSYVKIPKDEKS